MSNEMVNETNEIVTNEDEFIEVNVYTPYACASLLNKELKARGIEKIIRPQMVYNYVKNNRIESVVIEDENGKQLTMVREDHLFGWFNKYINNNTSRKNTPTVIRVKK